jgi:hypothetical protein
LAEIAQQTSGLATSGLAALALALAREMDDDNSATSKSMCAGQLRETLDRLRELAPGAEEADEFDELAAQRAARLARKSAAKA